jgi:hypothetical protein
MTTKEIEELESYAKSIEITRAALCSLVVQRELRVSRLKRKSRRHVSRQTEGGEPERRRVTVHISNPALKTAFTAYVKSLGLGSDEATFVLFREELKERWLFRAFGHTENHG